MRQGYLVSSLPDDELRVFNLVLILGEVIDNNFTFCWFVEQSSKIRLPLMLNIIALRMEKYKNSFSKKLKLKVEQAV